jgi:hypothetical protein
LALWGPKTARNLVEDVALELAVGAVVEGLELVPGAGESGLYGQVHAAQVLDDITTEAQFEPVDAVVGIVFVAVFRLRRADAVAVGDALALGPTHHLPLQQVRAL